MVHRKAVFYPRECHDILDSRSRGTWSEASVLKKKLKGSPSAKSIIHRVNRSSLFYSVTNGIESLFFNFIYTTPFNQHKPHNLLYLLVPSSSRLIIIKINKDTSHKNTRLTKIFLSIYHTFTSLPHSSIIVCHSRSNHALVSRETREVAGTRLDHMGTWFDNLFPLYVSRRICRKRKKKRGGKDVRTNEARATKLKKKSLRERGNVVGKKYFSSREDTVISLVRRSALRKGRGVTELYESTPVLSLSLRIPSPSIILLLRPSTTQTPSLPSRRSSLSSFHPLSLSLSLSVSSFIPLFLHPRFWLSPLSCPSFSTPLRLLFASFFYPLNAPQSSLPVGPSAEATHCASIFLPDPPNPFSPDPSTNTPSLFQRVFLSFFPTVSFASSPRHVYIYEYISVRIQRYLLPLFPMPFILRTRPLFFAPLLSFAILLLSRLLFFSPPHESIREFRVHGSRDAMLFIAIHCLRSLPIFSPEFRGAEIWCHFE